MPLKPEVSELRGAPRFRLAANAISYRIPLSITQVMVLPGGDAYPICPRCDCSFDGAYTQFCARCGQRLSWELFPFVRTRHPGGK